MTQQENNMPQTARNPKFSAPFTGPSPSKKRRGAAQRRGSLVEQNFFWLNRFH
jgi:hypothetical protein